MINGEVQAYPSRNASDTGMTLQARLIFIALVLPAGRASLPPDCQPDMLCVRSIKR